MKVLQINAVYPTGSTGKICKGIYQKCIENSIECYVAYSFGSIKTKEGFPINNKFFNKVSNRLSRITMLEGHYSPVATFKLIHLIKKIKPDIIHIHNIHENFVNIKPLLKYLNNLGIPVVLTVHDCWFFTGYCRYFSSVSCEKWKTMCSNCPKRGIDKVNLFDNSRHMFDLKKRVLGNINNLTIVSPSRWLYSLCKESFLGDKKMLVINNGVDLTTFKPTDSSFREDNGISKNDFVILGVAASWEKRKGLDTFITLAQKLGDEYRIVLVGTNDVIDKSLPDNIISIHQTHNQTELAKIYSAADLFVNPTMEEVFGLVNIESLACGTPVITYNTGGSPETIDNSCGIVVQNNTVEELIPLIENIKVKKPYKKENCVERAKAFDANDKYEEYVQLYKELYKGTF